MPDYRRPPEPPHPWVYLHHWALRLFADELIRGGRMLRVLRRGTLLMSAMNLLEVGRQAARASDRSPVMRILDFLEATGPGWAIIDISRTDVVRRELLGDPFPWMNRLWEYRARRELGCISLAPFVGKTTFPWAKAVLNQWEHEAAEVTWHLPEGPFTYWRGRVVEFRVLR